MATVYSYIRFSSKKQELGTSLNRQEFLRDQWLSQHPEHILDKTLHLQDLGISAFKGANLDPAQGALGKFIECIDQGKIEDGSILLLEKLDRFSRNDTWKAYACFGRIVESGITIIALDPEITIDQSNLNNQIVVLTVILQLISANDYSNSLSKRLSSFWSIQRKKVSEDGIKLCSICPSWLKYNKKEDVFEILPNKAKAIKYIFDRTLDGIGQSQIAKELSLTFPTITKGSEIRKFNDQTKQVDIIGTKEPNWNKSYVQKILHDRSVIGEFQVYKFDKNKKRLPIGDPILNYFPKVISNNLFNDAQNIIEKRNRTKGPKSDFVNILSGIVYCIDGHKMHIQTTRCLNKKKNKQYIQRRLVSYGHKLGLKNSCKYTVDSENLTNLILIALSGTPIEHILGNKSDINDRKKSIYFELSRLDKIISEYTEALDDSPLSVKKIILDKIEKCCNDKIIHQNDLKQLESYAYEDLIDCSKSSTSDINSLLNSDVSKELCESIRDYIPKVVKRIELTPRKRKNNVVEADGTIFLNNGKKLSICLMNNKRIVDTLAVTVKDMTNYILTSKGMIYRKEWMEHIVSFQNDTYFQESNTLNIVDLVKSVEFSKTIKNIEIRNALKDLISLKEQFGIDWIYKMIHYLVNINQVDIHEKAFFVQIIEYLLFIIEWKKRVEASVVYEKH